MLGRWTRALLTFQCLLVYPPSGHLPVVSGSLLVPVRLPSVPYPVPVPRGCAYPYLAAGPGPWFTWLRVCRRYSVFRGAAGGLVAAGVLRMCGLGFVHAFSDDRRGGGGGGLRTGGDDEPRYSRGRGGDREEGATIGHPWRGRGGL